MSRRSFRASVATPRPVSAWALVGVASAALWITRQLDPAIMAVQVLALAVGFAKRQEPFPWQRSPIAINGGMLDILAATAAIGSRGGPATIALAHFTALTQALQLLDARPRKSEFLRKSKHSPARY